MELGQRECMYWPPETMEGVGRYARSLTDPTGAAFGIHNNTN